ncbi:phage tail tape measure protein [Lachnospiraceae bacterium CLA-AA-H246]|uniref:Phage tail tape measure protein n=1 Tax=Hominisplanchenecus faecis TaxID=2885351 RepID=A0ABS8EU05_9FIRM|nr:phage tail tape measure protein [Hominisplanchenecus faecis]MCC2148434.1 phage tail tape measure protein [Hominisplanchenecus faecis]
MADGTLRFDTEIDESGFQKGLKRIEQAAKGATQQTASDAQDAAKQAEQAVSQAAEEAGKDAEKAAKQVENALEDVQEAAEDAADAVTDAAEDAGQDAAESVQDAVDNIVESVEEAGESAAEAVEDAMSDVVDSVSDAAKDVGDSASDIGDSIGDGFEEGTDQASTAIDALAQALVAAGVTASVKAITDALMGCTQASMEFETAMAKVGTIADESQKPLGDMRNEILALSSETGKSVGELAEATYQAISASVATESAVDFVGTANKLAVGGFSDTTTAVDILTTAINAYGMSADDAAKISDVLITTQNLGKTSVAQLGASMGMVIPLAAAYNMDLEDLSASYALLTANGTQTAQATTYVKAALNELGSTSSVVGSTLKKKTGKTFAELMAEGNSLGDVLQVLADSVDGDTTAFNNMWSSSEAGVGMLSILNSGTSKYNSLVQSMEGSTGAATAAFDKMSATGEFAQQRFQNATENLKIAIGDELAPVLMELQQSGADAMEWATEFVKEHPEVVAAVTALAAALAVLAAALVGLLVVQQVTTAFTKFSAALLANPVGAVAVALTALTAAAVAFGAVMKDRTSESVKNRKAIEQCKDSYDELKDSMEEHAKERKESIKSAKTEAATYQNLADKLYELADKTNKTASDKAQMNTIVDQLNGAMPKLGLSVDETTGALNREKSAVDAVIDSMKQQALANAYQEQANKAASDLAEAQIQLSEAEEVLNDLRSQAVKKINEHNAAIQDGTESVQEMASSYAAAGEPVDKYALQLNALNGQIKEQKEVVAGLQGTTSEADERYNKIAEKAYEYKTAVEESNQGVSDSATEMSDEVKQAYEDMKTSIQNSLKGIVNEYEEFSGDKEISAEDIIKHMHSSENAANQWVQNMKTLAGRAGDGMTKELYDHLLELGPQSANLVKACTEMTKPQLEEYARSFSATSGEAVEASTEELSAISANWENAGQEIAQKAGEVGEKSGKEHTEKAKSGIESGQKEVTEAAKKGGEEAGKESQKATADGIQQNSGQVSQAASSSIRKAEDAALGYYNGFYNVGANLMRGTVAGMTANSPAVEEAARAAVRNAVAGAKKEGNIKSPSRVMRDEVGEMLAAGMAVGIDEGSGDVEKSARDLAKVSVDAAKDELGIHSPSKVFKDEIGKHIVGGVIKGIEAEVPKLKKTMKKMSEEAVKAAGEVDAAKGGYSDAASAIMESITSGLDKRQELLVSKLDNKIDGYVDKVVKKYEKLAEDKKTEAGNTTDATQKKKLQEEAKKLRKNAKKIKNYANKYTSTFMDALKEGTEKAYSKIEDDLDKKLDEIADKYQKAYDKIISFRDDMKKKMSEPANMYDLDTQLTQVERYQEGMKKLRDKIPKSLMDQILGMDLNEADNFVEHLNAMSEEELEAYKKKWEQLQGSSETYSKEFFEQRLTDTKAGWTKEVEEAAKTAQEATEEAGKKIAKSLIKSLNGEKETLKKSMRGIAKDMIEAFKKAFGLGKSNKSAKSTKTSTNAKGTTTSGKTTAKKKKAKGTDDSELDLETLKANAASKKKMQKLAKKGRLSEVGKVLEALPTPFEDTEQKKAALQKLDPKLLASLDRFEQMVNQLGNSITVSNAGNASIGKLLEAASNQTIQLQAELHTTVDLDGRTVGKAVTPYVNENMNTIRNRQRRGS